ncbi:hypothetical protein BKA58DRAFT_387575 [Alternaria rosae]|uniref:uncharacterized protein n=1 Tax=Alternaria rosae TaxID=1187941 RepID=UPI001E8D795E|nr:uncharacterized protein BKA58DRAFT_387575 [Alternaria rosae]KAH6868777.1 hypothetical protein BKA58DRAFT_387575 [Alternaria rosae]
MALLELADELLALIVDRVIPEGFENLCLSCRKFYTLCKPLLKHHNELRSHFRNFNYFVKDKYPSLTIRTPFELIARIAEEPVVARYIEYADFKADLRIPVGRRLWLMEENGYRPETVRNLFASSQYLSGTEWQDYFEKYERGLEDNRYTQAASAFLLTLLPNVKTVVLPFRWTHDKETEKLLQAIVHHARQPNTTSTNASLALVTTLKTGFSFAMRQGLVLNKITPLLALPRIHTFHGPTSTSDIEAREPSSPRQPIPPPVGGTLEIAYLRGCNLDGPTMQHFLRYTPRLKTLVYSHSDKQLSRIWDICELVTTIGAEAGSHLEELSITKHEFSGKIALGTATMRDFPRLHKLEIPLDLATCVIRSADHLGRSPAADVDQSQVNLLMCGLVPASVTRLFLTSDEWKSHDDNNNSTALLEMIDGVPVFEGRPQQHERTLEAMFQGFADKKDAQLPCLKEIRMSCHWSADEALKVRCESLRAEVENVGVEVHVHANRWKQAMDYAGRSP